MISRAAARGDLAKALLHQRACSDKFLLLLLFLRSTTTDFLFAAGNWTHSTNLFSELHFVPATTRRGGGTS